MRRQHRPAGRRRRRGSGRRRQDDPKRDQRHLHVQPPEPGQGQGLVRGERADCHGALRGREPRGEALAGGGRHVQVAAG